MIFDNGRTILCGIEPSPSTEGLGKLSQSESEPSKHTAGLYGIGGKRESTDANYRETAAREMLEELFGFHRPSRMLLQRILLIPPHKETTVSGYIMLHYGFDDLVKMLLTLRGQTSPFYDKMPTSISELILARRHVAKAEMSHLCLLPMTYPTLYISSDLANDINRILSE